MNVLFELKLKRIRLAYFQVILAFIADTWLKVARYHFPFGQRSESETVFLGYQTFGLSRREPHDPLPDQWFDRIDIYA